MTTVEKIHNEIDTAQDRLLNEAKLIIADSENEVLKANRLVKIGFINAPEVKTSDQIVQNIETAKLIEYYKQAYPFQKFLTEKEFDRICEKYKLVYAEIKRYIKSVPDKNISDIEKMPALRIGDSTNGYILFKVNCRITGLTSEELSMVRRGIRIEGKDYMGSDNSYNLTKHFRKAVACEYNTIHNSVERIDQEGLFIAAPKSHFNLSGLKKKGFGFFTTTIIKPKDPIVFRYVRGGIQVITKWGIEAEDKDLVNEKMN